MAVAFVGCSSLNKARSSDSDTETSSTGRSSSDGTDAGASASGSSGTGGTASFAAPGTGGASTSVSTGADGSASSGSGTGSSGAGAASSGSAGSGSSLASGSSSGSSLSDWLSGAGIANPFEDYSTQSAAETAAGFNYSIPANVPFSYDSKVNRAIPNELLEITYGNSSDGDEVRLRKAKLPADSDVAAAITDISGDYNKYLITKNMSAGDKRVELRGEVNNYHVAKWTDGDYIYSVTSKNGITEEEILNFVSQLN